VAARLAPGDVVMIKGSAGSRMGRVLTALRQGNGSTRDATGDDAL
jgi:UDP-N-acetylmuramyl pentapeptide synthase